MNPAQTPNINVASLLSGLATNPSLLSLQLLNPQLAQLMLLMKLQQPMNIDPQSSLLLSLLSNPLLNTQAMLPKQELNATQAIPQANLASLVNLPQQLNIGGLTAPRETMPDPNKNTKSHIRDILDFVLENIGRISEAALEKEKAKYSFDKNLEEIFDLLIKKYSSTIKTKEEMVKYVIRRAFKSVKNHLKKEKNIDARTACKIICEKYFKISKEELKEKGIDPEDEEELLDALLPFRKNSKNRTMNNEFLAQIFSSEAFKSDYETFMTELDDTLNADNNRKMDKLVTQIEGLIKRKALHEISGFKRIPWLKIWIEKTRGIAKELIKSGEDLGSKSKKKVHKEDPKSGAPSLADDSASQVSHPSN